MAEVIGGSCMQKQCVLLEAGCGTLTIKSDRRRNHTLSKDASPGQNFRTPQKFSVNPMEVVGIISGRFRGRVKWDESNF